MFNKVFTLRFIGVSVILSSIYFALVVYIINYRLVLSTVFGGFDATYKFKLLFELVKGSYFAFSFFGFFVLVLQSILVGVNIVLIFKSFRRLQENNSPIKFAIGGGSMLSLVSIGCGSCSFSILSALGLGVSFSLLPFSNTLFGFLSLFLLGFSAFYTFFRLNKLNQCKI